jgi:uncharacterized protein
LFLWTFFDSGRKTRYYLAFMSAARKGCDDGGCNDRGCNDDMTTGPKPGTMKAGMFDAFRLARDRDSLQGEFDAAASERLYDWLAPGDAPIRWSITGTTDVLGRLAIAIELAGSVPMECQRCLESLQWPVEQRTVALLAKNEADAETLDADSEDEVVLASEPLDALALVEDELLLSLPYAPAHPDGECAAPA